MNATSSRAHTVVTIHFDQIIKTNVSETKKTSVINLVDLAGNRKLNFKLKIIRFCFVQDQNELPVAEQLEID
jgi:hypothetical protein